MSAVLFQNCFPVDTNDQTEKRLQRVHVVENFVINEEYRFDHFIFIAESVELNSICKGVSRRIAHHLVCPVVTFSKNGLVNINRTHEYEKTVVI